MRLPRLLLSVLLSIAVLGSVPAASSARVPQGFVGMMADGQLLSGQVNLGRQLDNMVSTGVESLRTVFNWAGAEPYATWADVPAAQRSRFTDANGRPIDFSSSDTIVGAAAQRGLSVMPVILFTPQWAAAPVTVKGSYPDPASAATFAAFTTVLVQRYGPHGSFWRSHPRIRAVPIRMWQIWNEPNLSLYWYESFPDAYVNLVHAAHDAIHQVDPGAKVVLAGMPNNSWDAVASIYRVPNASHYFDVVATHPFTAQPAGVITILQRVRDAMNQAGDTRKPIIASEVSFPSSVGKAPSQHFGFETTEAGQARNLRALLPLLAAARNRLHLLAFYHYNWIGREHRGDKSFSFAGLLRMTQRNRLVAKPALAAFRGAALAIEGCRVKGTLATRCRKR
jgi:hypothetical protein